MRPSEQMDMQPSVRHYPATARPEPVSARPARVTLVERDPTWRRGLRRLLRRSNAHGGTTEDGCGARREGETTVTSPQLRSDGSTLTPVPAPASQSSANRPDGATLPASPTSSGLPALGAFETVKPALSRANGAAWAGDTLHSGAKLTETGPVDGAAHATGFVDPAEQGYGESAAFQPPPDYRPSLCEVSPPAPAIRPGAARFVAFNGHDRRRGERRANSGMVAMHTPGPLLPPMPSVVSGALVSLLGALDAPGSMLEIRHGQSPDEARVVIAARSAPLPVDYLPRRAPPCEAEAALSARQERPPEAPDSDSAADPTMRGVPSSEGGAPLTLDHARADAPSVSDAGMPARRAETGVAAPAGPALSETRPSTRASIESCASASGPYGDPASGAGHRRSPAIDEVVSCTVIAQPFASFRDLNGFVSAVAALPGVRRAAPRRFRAGTLHLAVEYSGPLSLASLLTRLEPFALTIGEGEDRVVSVLLESR